MGGVIGLLMYVHLCKLVRQGHLMLTSGGTTNARVHTMGTSG